LVDEAELAKRRAVTTVHSVPAESRGYDRMFRENVLQAPEGCDFGFCQSAEMSAGNAK